MKTDYEKDWYTYNTPNNPEFWVDDYLDEDTGITYTHRVWDRDRVLLIRDEVVLRYMPIEEFNPIKGRLKKLKVKIR